MEYGSCIVRISGNVEMEVFKEKVSAAELVVLRSIHGPDGLTRVYAYGQDKRPHAEEVQRLARIYGGAAVAAVYPGAAPQLPVKFKDTGISFQRGKDPQVHDVAPAAADEDPDHGDDGDDGASTAGTGD